MKGLRALDSKRSYETERRIDPRLLPKEGLWYHPQISFLIKVVSVTFVFVVIGCNSLRFLAFVLLTK